MECVMNRASSISRAIRQRTAPSDSPESTALAVGTTFFTAWSLVSCAAFWGRDVGIAGRGSLGEYLAAAAAITAALAFVLGRVYMERQRRIADGREETDAAERPGPLLNWFDTAVLAIAHAVIAALAWNGFAEVVADSFRGAVVFAYMAALLTGAAAGLTAWAVFLSAVRVSATRLPVLLAVLLVTGGFASMLRASDPRWWRWDLSVLGITKELSALSFTVTLVVAGALVTIIARHSTGAARHPEADDARARAFVRTGLIAVGILLVLVGVLPVDKFWLLHTSAATGMAVVFGAMVIGLPWIAPSAPRGFIVRGYVFAVVIAVSSVLFAIGYYTLTAVEIVAAVLIVSWIMTLSRTMIDLPSTAATVLPVAGAVPVAEGPARGGSDPVSA
jgi:hypothetical membrane protein